MIYRYPKEGQIAGVCVGLAKYFGLDTWVVRITIILLFFFGGALFLPLAYFAAVFLMEKAPESYYLTSFNNVNFKGAFTPPSKVGQKIQQIRLNLEHTKQRVTQLEKYTQSNHFRQG